MIPMLDTFIYQVNILGKDQQELLVFTDLIEWGPTKIGNENDLDYQDNHEYVHTEQDTQTIIQQPVKVKLETL